jgi:excisionase family DNA binding protein
MNEFMTIKECAEYIRSTAGTVRVWCSQRRIPYSKPGGRLLFKRIEIDKWIAASAVKVDAIYQNKVPGGIINA